MARLECLEVGAVALRKRDVIEPFEQAPLLEWMDLECMRPSVGAGHSLLRQVHFDGRADIPVKLPAHLGGNLRGHANRQQTVFQAIAREYVAKTRRYDRPEAKGVQRVDSALPR
jgi:hypothetical protein